MSQEKNKHSNVESKATNFSPTRVADVSLQIKVGDDGVVAIIGHISP